MALVPLAALVPPAHAAGTKVRLHVLVVTSGDPSSTAIAVELEREGVPHTVVQLGDSGRPVLDEGFLVDAATGAARFQAVVLPNAAPAGLGAEELSALRSYERAHGIRRVNAYVYPGTGSGATATYAGSLDGAAATVTPAARATGFSALSGPLPIDDFSPGLEVYGYLAQLDTALPEGQSATALLTARAGGDSGAIAWSYAHGGREELMVSAAYNSSMQWYNTVAHGVVSWMTRGIHLGFHRSYLDVQVDDVFLPDSRWSVAGNCTPGDDCVDRTLSTPDIRMTAADVRRLVDWQRAHGFRLDMVFNGGGAVAARAENSGTDPLTDAFLASKAEFPWVNHTWNHPYLGCIQIAPTVAGRSWHCATAPDETPRQDPDISGQESGGTYWAEQSFVRAQVQQNIDWARANALPNFDATELVTGEHSGLATAPQQPTDNPFLAAALGSTGVRYIASDASRERDPRAVGEAVTVPRYPMNVYYNAATYREQIDEYNWYYTSRADGGSGICEDNPASTCIAPLPAGTEAEARTSFQGYLAPLEVRNALGKVLANDPRSFYAHQSNLAEDGLLYPVVEGVLEQYRATHAPTAPLVQISLREQGEVLARAAAWRAVAARTTAYLDDSGVHLSAAAGVQVPLTVPAGTRETGVALASYGGERSGWIAAPTADTLVAVPAARRGGYTGTATPVTVPAPATAVAAVAGNASATVTWAEPVTDGGSALTGYAVRAWAAGSPALSVDVPAGQTTATVDGLANGTAYTFEVLARNALGDAPPSGRSVPVTPAAPVTGPGAPVPGAVVAGDATATLTWSAPASDGGSPLTGYVARAYEAGSDVPSLSAEVDAAATGATFAGLVNGTAYSFDVLARNAAGSGVPSRRSASVIPAAVPGAPVISSATAGDASVTLAWSPPATDGGAPVTGYVVRVFTGGGPTPAREVPVGAGTSATVTGLVDGTPYVLDVLAVNAAGRGAASPPSPVLKPVAPVPVAPAPVVPAPVVPAPVVPAPVVPAPVVPAPLVVAPATVPGAPVTGAASPGAGGGAITATARWSPPRTDGGSPVTGYRVTALRLDSRGAVVQTVVHPVLLPAAARSLRMSLPVAGRYRFTVRAVNDAGTGVASARSRIVAAV
ncbi:fibronectin type III domain-containing protein [Kineococcus sp. NUM-3379]